MTSSAAEGKKPVLMVAAESIAAASGMVQTVADVLRGRALRHYDEALRQYLTIRLADHKIAQRAMVELDQRVASWPSGELMTTPGARARLFRLARDIARELSGRPGAAKDSAPKSVALAWHRPDPAAGSGYARGLEAMRSHVAPDHAELLELRYARELSPQELSYVLGEPLEKVITDLAVAASCARAFLGPTPPSQLGGLRGALQEAFALEVPRGHRPQSKRQALPSGTIIGERYALESRVGEGSFGDVYRALDTDVPGHVVALKLLHQRSDTGQMRKTALRELRLIASVFHPSVVDFKDHGWFDERLWFVMPWYEGETLEDRIRRAPLTRAEAKDIFIPLAQALATMHESGIRHQDIKPDNIYLARIGEAGRDEARILPVLIDLGVAAKEAEMIVAGTPLYFPPEIAAQYASKPARPVTFKADVFSLMLSLRNALEPSTQEKVPGTAVEAFISYRADHPPEPPEAKSLGFLAPHFERWLALDAAERPSAEELAAELQVLTRPEQRRARQKALVRWIGPLAMGSAVALGSVTYVYLQERQESQRARTLAESRREDLHHESARRQQLEVASAALQQDYVASLLSRDELAQRLADRNVQNRKLEHAIGAARRAQHQLDVQLDGVRKQLVESETELSQKRRSLDALHDSVAKLEADLETAKGRESYLTQRVERIEARLRRSENDLNDARTRSRELLDALEVARADAMTEQDRASRMERALIHAQQERSQAQRDLVTVQQRVAALTRSLGGAHDPSVEEPPALGL